MEKRPGFSSKGEKNILVLGIGNILLADEGAGIHVIRKLESLALPTNIELLEGGTGGLDLIFYLRGRDKIVIIDCVNIEDKPGSIYRLTLEDLEKAVSVNHNSMHQVGLIEMIKLFSLSGNKGEIIIIGIVPETYGEYQLELSPTLGKLLPEIVKLVIKETQ